LLSNPNKRAEKIMEEIMLHKKKIIAILTFLVLFLSMSVPHAVVAARTDEQDLHSITVVKYQVPDNVFVQEIPIGASVPNLTGADGNRLERMSGVTYRLIRVESNGNIYIPVTGEGAFYQEETTNENGLALFNGLPAGIYMLIELEHDYIPAPEEPVIIYLPMRVGSGEYLLDVYVYPKSNMVPPEDPYGRPEEEPPGEQEPPGRLPQTSGNIGSLFFIGIIAAILISLGGFGAYLLKRKEM
jgi:hypothetical protein